MNIYRIINKISQNKYYLLLLFLFINISILVANNFSDPKKDGYVPNAETAIKIAEAIWLPIYGKDIYCRLPFKATLVDGHIWQVTGTLPPEYEGGVPYIEIEKKDSRIIKVYHSK